MLSAERWVQLLTRVEMHGLARTLVINVFDMYHVLHSIQVASEL